MDRLPRRADGALDGEGDFLRHVDVLADEFEVGCALRNRRRHVAATPGKPDVVDVGQVARHANRRRHDRVELLVEMQLPQRLFQDLRAGASIHALLDEIAVAVGIKAVAPPDARARRLADDFRLVEDRQRQDPARVLQRHEPAASRLAAGQRGHLVDELGACVGDRERHPERVGYPGRAEENVGIAEIRAALREALPQRPGPPSRPRAGRLGHRSRANRSAACEPVVTSTISSGASATDVAAPPRS